MSTHTRNRFARPGPVASASDTGVSFDAVHLRPPITTPDPDLPQSSNRPNSGYLQYRPESRETKNHPDGGQASSQHRRVQVGLRMPQLTPQSRQPPPLTRRPRPQRRHSCREGKRAQRRFALCETGRNESRTPQI